MILIFVKDMKFPVLLDTYGSLLSERKREILDYYYNDDYSLAEISEITGISRQGVRDSIKKSEEELFSLEEKLGLARKNLLLSEITAKIEKCIHSLEKSGADSEAEEILRDALNTITSAANADNASSSEISENLSGNDEDEEGSGINK